MGRRPVADFHEFFRGSEQSPIEPFRNIHTGSFMGFVSRLETDAISIGGQGQTIGVMLCKIVMQSAFLGLRIQVIGEGGIRTLGNVRKR